MGGGGEWDLFFLSVLRALLEASPKSAAGSNLGGAKMPLRAQSLQKRSSWSLAHWTVLLRCPGPGGRWGWGGPSGRWGGVVVPWAQGLLCGQPHCLFHIPLTNDKGDAQSGEVAQHHTASQGQSLQKRTELFCHGECLCREYSTLSW